MPHDTPIPSAPQTVPSRGSYREKLRIGAILRKETVGGFLLVFAAAVALIWANSPAADSYFALRDFRIGYEPWHLELSLGAWAADGLLAIFFFLVGLELKKEFVAGDLRSPSRAIVPVAAAMGGVAVPALFYAGVNLVSPETLQGWAIPTATDIAFAVAVLAIVGSHLPSALRIFLLTLAVVDDLLAISIIAVFYSDDVQVGPLLLALIPLALYTFLAQKYRRFFADRAWAAWLILLPLGFATWALVHAGGIHATVAGVLLGFAVPVIHRRTRPGVAAEEGPGLSETFEHRFRPLSAGFAVPVFAFFSAGVTVGGWDGLVGALTDPVAIGIIVGLVLGKPVGIVGTTWLMTRLTPVKLDPALRWIDLIGVAVLAGIGFTVSLLIADLSFGAGSLTNDHAKVGILVASITAALLASVILRARNRLYRRIEQADAVDADGDGIPDAYQQGEPDRTPAD
ncbi:MULTISPECIES: Na+/H+ antiporter NhaA [Cryobacterium]|uniref:Na(+)/H(+) antiporter NhaA n=1 Tax=Cryobacterium zongtaii TaxID=1259217 RepID=A0A2S3ZGS2_9MICO|nr:MULTISPECIES: Na+/H+ antiporter NhaA [Cryobacterium]POH63757.1 Na+/H+ antiporter NhaA [Cryobacterium zongtaii]POH66539.1 Na+/H+ antiporter NhaA [Cryobacterium zongtaii]TFC40890.1 Na+/H+ antiporter NhaA [Cryobacterium sp. TMN-39-2]TFC59673.1 Na+/H+ antiporter NhaA [Cryobacterium sp. TMB3-1-2]TFC68128.1 Na+/H+ antiporter NhaA [Cryobacterium sp. TMB3-15]